MIKVLVVILAIIFIFGFLWAQVLIGIFASLADASLVEKLLKDDRDPFKVVFHSSWAHFVNQVANALHAFLNDVFTCLMCHDFLEVGHKDVVNELLDSGRKRLLHRQASDPLDLVIGVLLTHSES